MKKQIIIAISVFLAIVVLGAGIYYFSSSRGENNTAIQPSDQQKENNKNALLQVKKLNCDDAAGAEEKVSCQAEAVKILNSPSNSACEDLTTEDDKSSCRQAYIIKEAADSGNLDKCNEIAEKSSVVDCLAQVSYSLAIQKKDKKYCENIINKNDKESCLKSLADISVK